MSATADEDSTARRPQAFDYFGRTFRRGFSRTRADLSRCRWFDDQMSGAVRSGSVDGRGNLHIEDKDSTR
jgi:hypothetical protein